jgi:hypothetical protein
VKTTGRFESPEWPYKDVNINNRIRKGQEQANCLIIFFTKPVNVKMVERIIKGRFKDHRNFKKAEIWVGYQRIKTFIK